MMRLLCTLAAFSFATFSLPGQNTPIILEVEDGDLAGEWSLESDGDTQFATIETDLVNGAYPGAARVISLPVEFPAAGTYELYARIRIGAGSYEDDSFFYGNGFGEKDPASGDDWIIVNQLVESLGFNAPGDVVRAGSGGLDTGEWFWVKLTGFDYGATSLEFPVGQEALSLTFQLGAREDGLDLDKIAFGRKGIYFTVQNLETGTEGSTTPPEGPAVWEGPPYATGHEQFLGSVFSATQEEHFAAYWNQVTPENAGKWGSVEATRDSMNWSGLDAAYELAKANDFPFRFHVLVWGSQQPDWIEDLPADEQLGEIEEWFAAVAERYPEIDYLEVVNEPLHQPPTASHEGNYHGALGGAGETGWDWIVTAFELAREYFPGTPLMINEYNIINNSGNTNRYIGIIELLQERGLIDLIGLQTHAFSTRNATVANMSANLDALAATGLPLMVTEMEIDGPGENGDRIQLEEYQRVFPVVWEHPAVVGVTLWGFRTGLWRHDQGAYLLRNDGSERPAMEWLRDYVMSTAANTWLGYPVENDWALTGEWLGDVYIGHHPWIWTRIGWLYVAEETNTAGGAWVYSAR